MRDVKRYGFESLLDSSALNENQRVLINHNAENQACNPCDCDAEDEGSCRCN